MSDPKKPKTVWPLPAASKPPEGGKADRDAAGKVVHDARGNAVWDWSRSPNDSTTHLLRKLDSPELALADDAVDKAPEAHMPDAGGGLDPYNRRNEQRAPTPPRGGTKPEPPEPKAPQSKAAQPNAPQDSVLKQLLGKR